MRLSKMRGASLEIGSPSSMHSTWSWLGGLTTGLVPSRREKEKSSR